MRDTGSPASRRRTAASNVVRPTGSTSSISRRITSTGSTPERMRQQQPHVAPRAVDARCLQPHRRIPHHILPGAVDAHGQSASSAAEKARPSFRSCAGSTIWRPYAKRDDVALSSPCIRPKRQAPPHACPATAARSTALGHDPAATTGQLNHLFAAIDEIHAIDSANQRLPRPGHRPARHSIALHVEAAALPLQRQPRTIECRARHFI